jgi:Holliday junction resolvase RusA-like endonuclease
VATKSPEALFTKPLLRNSSRHFFCKSFTSKFQQDFVNIPRPSASKFPTPFFIQKPKKSKYHYPALSDLENLIKNVNDRLQGVIFENDSQIVEISARKVFHDHAGFFVKVEEKIDETE